MVQLYYLYYLNSKFCLKSFLFGTCYLFCIALGTSIRQYGEACNVTEKHSLFCNHDQNVFCHDEKCRCSISSYLMFTEKAQPFCHSYVKVWSYYLQNDQKCQSPCSSDQFCSHRGYCHCKNKEVLVDGKCHEAVYEGPMKACYVDDDHAILCDPQQLTYCNDEGVCACFMEYSYNSSSRKCELKKPQYFCRGEMKYKPGDFCFDDSDCFEGLVCLSHNNTCACPRFCSYVPDKGTCSCGEVEMEPPEGVIWCGVIFGLLSTWFWLCLITKLFKKYAGERTSQGDHSVVVDSTQLTESMLSQAQNDNIRKDSPPTYDQPPPYSDVVSQPPYSPIGSSDMWRSNSYSSSLPPPYPVISSEPALRYATDSTQVGFLVPVTLPAEPSVSGAPSFTEYSGSAFDSTNTETKLGSK